VCVITTLRYEDQIVVVTPYFRHADFRDYLPHMTLEDIRYYMHSLFKAVKHVHDHFIIHRDLKPSNFLYSIKKKRGLLIDFGLAQNYLPSLNNRETRNVTLPSPASSASPQAGNVSSLSVSGVLTPKYNCNNKNLKIISIPQTAARRSRPGYYVNDNRYPFFVYFLLFSLFEGQILKLHALVREDFGHQKSSSSVQIKHQPLIFGASASSF
jgi:serine/threonine protein kinase